MLQTDVVVESEIKQLITQHITRKESPLNFKRGLLPLGLSTIYSFRILQHFLKIRCVSRRGFLVWLKVWQLLKEMNNNKSIISLKYLYMN